jgi:hypothetical protein
MPNRAIFTVLFGSYEQLNELPPIARGVAPSYCFTDDPNLTSSSWTVIHVEPRFPMDIIRSQRLVKILGHPLLDQFDETLYLDNSVTLKANPTEILDTWLRDSEIAIPSHSFHATLNDEFDAVIEQQLDSPTRISEQRDHYTASHASSLTSAPNWTAIIARKATPRVNEFQQIWAAHVLRYSRRDQLSVGVALTVSRVAVNCVRIDNLESDLHRWPAGNQRRVERRTEYWPEPGDMGTLLASANDEIAHLRSELFAVWGSPSWKLTRPLRGIAKLFRRLTTGD